MAPGLPVAGLLADSSAFAGKRPFRFAFVSNSAEVGEAVRHHIDPRTDQLTVRLATMEEAVPVARALLESGIEVVIGGGGTGSLLAETIGQPVVKLDRDPLDVFRALVQARRHGRTIAITSFARPLEGTDLYEEYLSVGLRQIVFSNSRELEAGILRAVRAGCQVVVGGGICREIATAAGARGIVVVPRRESVLQTLQEARAVAAAHRKERQSLEELRTILDTSREGIIVLDNAGRVKLLNPAALAILRPVLSLQHALIPGERLPDVLLPLGLTHILQSPTPELDKVRRLAGVDLVVSALPIQMDGTSIGVVGTFREATRIQNIDRKVREKLYQKGFVARYTFEQLRGSSPALLQVVASAKRYAETDASILIEGETGTGKELLAQSIHNASRRSMRPFLGVNCSAFSESLLESELFGYEEGAFTGARRGGKIGLFEMAHGGSLFLDEIADISTALQLKLLRVIEEKEIMRLGGDRIVLVDVRVISSSQRNLYGANTEPRFRSDLYFRLATLRLRLPPLRQRFEDLPELTIALFRKHGRPIENFSRRVWDALARHSWPGNVRELDSLVRMYLALTDSPTFDEQLFLSALAEICRDVGGGEEPEEGRRGTLKEQLRHHEEKIIEQTLREARYSRSETARRLGISVNSLWRKAPKSDG